MIELPLVFLGGLLGSAHCVGMCGGFAVSIGIGSRRIALQPAPATDLHGAGESSPIRFSESSPDTRASGSLRRAGVWINCQATLSMIAGVLLIGQSSLALGSGATAVLAEACRRRIALPGGNVRRAVPRLAALVARPARRGPHRLPALWPGLRLSGPGQQLGQHLDRACSR